MSVVIEYREFNCDSHCIWEQLYKAIAVEKLMVRCVFFLSFFFEYLMFLSHSQESDSEFVLVHDDELIGMLERDAAALDSEPGSSSAVLHAPALGSGAIQKMIENLA